MKNQHSRAVEKQSLILYSIFSVVGFCILYFIHGSLQSNLTIHSDDMINFDLFSIGIVAAGVLLLASEIMSEFFPSYQQTRFELERVLGGVSFISGIFLAVLSGFAEEILFRGAIQPFLGLFPTALLFGLLHLGPGFKINLWTLWAFGSGLLLGWLFESTGSLVPPIFAHIVVNAVSIQRLRYSYRKRMKEAQLDS